MRIQSIVASDEWVFAGLRLRTEQSGATVVDLFCASSCSLQIAAPKFQARVKSIFPLNHLAGCAGPGAF